MFRIRVRTTLIIVALVAVVMMMIAQIQNQDRESSRRWAIYRTALLKREVANAGEHARRAREARRLAVEYLRLAVSETDPDHARFLSRRAREFDREARLEAAQVWTPAAVP